MHNMFITIIYIKIIDSNMFQSLTGSSSGSIYIKYGISQPIRRNFSTEKCDLNSTRVLCAEGKYYFQTYKYPYI